MKRTVTFRRHTGRLRCFLEPRNELEQALMVEPEKGFVPVEGVKYEEYEIRLSNRGYLELGGKEYRLAWASKPVPEKPP